MGGGSGFALYLEKELVLVLTSLFPACGSSLLDMSLVADYWDL